MIIISDKQNCSGCHACMNACKKGCISMVPDGEGFLYPHVEKDLCVNCGACENVCPILSPMPENTDGIFAYAAYSKDNETRRCSSSGGIFTELAKHILSSSGVVFGAAFDENHEVCHTYIDKKENLVKLRGSKYVQSRIGDSYKDAERFLKEGRTVLFSGTPCQTDGLLKYLKKDYDNLITQDIICHGVPSPSVWKKYIEFREEKAKSKTGHIFFRHKKYGWRMYSLSFGFENGKEYRRPFRDDLYMRSYLSNLSVRPSCYNCRFKKKNRNSDITLADFWGINKIAPEMNDDKGTSLVFINSEKGRRIFEEIKDKTVNKMVDTEFAASCNKAMTHSADKPKAREAFMADIDSRNFDTIVNKYNHEKIILKARRKVKIFITGLKTR